MKIRWDFLLGNMLRLNQFMIGPDLSLLMYRAHISQYGFDNQVSIYTATITNHRCVYVQRRIDEIMISIVWLHHISARGFPVTLSKSSIRELSAIRIAWGRMDFTSGIAFQVVIWSSWCQSDTFRYSFSSKNHGDQCNFVWNHNELRTLQITTRVLFPKREIWFVSSLFWDQMTAFLAGFENSSCVGGFLVSMGVRYNAVRMVVFISDTKNTARQEGSFLLLTNSVFQCVVEFI